MNKSNKNLILIFTIVGVLTILAVSLLYSNFHLTVTEYNHASDKKKSAKILFISDLHGRSFGESNSRLLEKIGGQSPDIICLDGDFIDSDNTPEDNAEFINLVDKLTETAPVYYAYGNHDLDYFEQNGDALINDLENHGCTVLDKNYVDITIKDVEIRLGGLYDYAFNQKCVRNSVWRASDTYKFLSDFQNTDRTKILLSHRPDSFIYADNTNWNIDYVLSGHTHGGLWRFPFIGGVFAPEQGFFPEYDKGEFQLGDITMIISSGFAGHRGIPRLNNCPEISILELN